MIYLFSSLISAIGWGTIPLIDRYSSRYLNGLTLASTRGLTFGVCAIIIFLVLMYKKQNNIKEGYEKRGKLLIFLVIISPMMGFLLGHLGYYYALKSSPSSVVQIVLISHCLPLIIVCILAPIIYKDKINWQVILGIMITLLGISLTVIFNPNTNIHSKKQLN